MVLNYIPQVAAGTVSRGGVGAQAEFWTFNVNTAAASAIVKIYDGPAASGVLIATIDCSVIRSCCYGVRCPNGIYSVMSGGNADVTIGYK